jgi:hypothetical protein
MKSTPVKVNQGFGGKYHLHLQVGRISRARNQRESSPGSAISTGILFRVLLYSEDRGDMFLRNFWLSPNHTALQHRRPEELNLLFIFF